MVLDRFDFVDGLALDTIRVGRAGSAPSQLFQAFGSDVPLSAFDWRREMPGSRPPRPTSR